MLRILEANRAPHNSWSGPSCGITGAQQARHFILHLLRAAGRSARPLNCGVRRQIKPSCRVYANGVY